ncbi:hypothetical protein PENTCL1PPCAC_20058, partial [Pristionchus entomophagus]
KFQYVYDDLQSTTSCIAYEENDAICCTGIHSDSLTKLTSTRRIISGLCWKRTFGLQLEGGFMVIKYGIGDKSLVIDLKRRKGVKGMVQFDETITTMAITLSGKAWESLIYLGTKTGCLFKVIGIPYSYGYSHLSIDDIIEDANRYESRRSAEDRPRVWGVKEISMARRSIDGEKSPVISIAIGREEKDEPLIFPPPIDVIHANGRLTRMENDIVVGSEIWPNKPCFTTRTKLFEENIIFEHNHKLNFCTFLDGAMKEQVFEMEEEAGRVEGRVALVGSDMIYIEEGEIRVKKRREE